MVFIKDINRKGQLSMEFILIMSIVLILLLTMSLPMRDESERNMNMFTRVSYADKAMYDVYDTVMKVGNSSEGFMYVDIYIPENVKFGVKKQGITYSVNLDFNVSGYDGCANNTCTKALPFTGVSDQITSADVIIEQKGRYRLNVVKATSGDLSITRSS